MKKTTTHKATWTRNWWEGWDITRHTTDKSLIYLVFKGLLYITKKKNKQPNWSNSLKKRKYKWLFNLTHNKRDTN